MDSNDKRNRKPGTYMPSINMVSRKYSHSEPPADEMSMANMSQLWPKLRDVSDMDQLIEQVKNIGYFPVILKQVDMLRHGKGKSSDFGTIVGKLSSFGCLIDTKSLGDGGNIELIARELELIELGVSKCTINSLVRAIERSKNVGKPVCVIIDFCPTDTNGSSEALATAFLLHEDKGLFYDYNPTVVLGSQDGDIITKVDKDLIEHGCKQGLDAEKALLGGLTESESYMKEVDNGGNMLDKCRFTNVAMLTFESVTFGLRCK